MGTFTLCLNSPVDYDYYEGAEDVNSLINSCSADEAYTTSGATGDLNAGSNSSLGTTVANRWFKFTATETSIDVIVKTSASYGTQRRSQVAIWESNGTTEVASGFTEGDNTDVSVLGTGLIVGNEYYISVDARDVSRVGTFTLCITENSVLPIQLLSFQVKALTDTRVELNWETATEINNDYFTIERSMNLKDWEVVEKMNGAGNSNTILSYIYIDSNPLNGTSYYRIKQTDYDGKYDYSEIISVETNQILITELKTYPNPTTLQVTIEGDSHEWSNTVIFNAMGENVTNLTKQTIIGDTKLNIDLSRLSAGMYYITTKTTANKVYKQ